MLLTLYVTLMSGETPEPDVVATALGELYETRNWLMTWVCIECASTTLARRRRFDAISTIERFLDANGLSWSGNPRWSAMRAAALTTDDARDNLAATDRAARGPTMTRDELVTFVRQRLSDEAGLSSEPLDRHGDASSALRA